MKFVVAVASVAFALHQRDRCYDFAGNAYNLFTSSLQPVNQTSVECQALLSLAKSFGFSISTCARNISYSDPSDPTSLFLAEFCDPNTVVSVGVQNPPISLAALPSSLPQLQNFNFLGLVNAVYGNQIISPLFELLGNLTYFRTLDLQGLPTLANTPNRVLSGSLPPLTKSLFNNQFFTRLGLANNNFSGPLPANYGDMFELFDVSNNTLLNGPLPNSTVPVNITGTHGEWESTARCYFNNTQLCVPNSWLYQPSCLRYGALPTCDGGQVKPIDPTDPLLALEAFLNNSQSPAHGNSNGNNSLGPDDSGSLRPSYLNGVEIGMIALTVVVIILAGLVFISRFFNFKRRGVSSRDTLLPENEVELAILASERNGLPSYSDLAETAPNSAGSAKH